MKNHKTVARPAQTEESYNSPQSMMAVVSE